MVLHYGIPIYKKDIDLIEKVQGRATNLRIDGARYPYISPKNFKILPKI
jgi:hypothetical protein